jgi:hypothetical protein
MNNENGKIISYLDWLQLEYFIEPTHKLLLSYVNKNNLNDRQPFEMDKKEMKVLNEITFAMPSFHKDIFFTDN